MSPETRVTVAVVTFRRPAELDRLLTSLSSVHFPRPGRVLVVDNDAAGSAGAVVTRHQGSGMPLDYVIEAEPGIAAARNRAVRESRDDDFIVFVDDDEVASPNWLDHLLDAQARYDADVVAGPVLARLDGAAPWLAGAGFFDRPRRPTGPGHFLASSANLLVRTRITGTLGEELFDVRFGLTGGSDTLFSLRVQEAGLTMAWADDALVTEFFPPSRLSARWLLRRAYRGGTTMARCELAMAASTARSPLRASLVRAAKGMVHIAAGTAAVLPGSVRGRAVALRQLRRVALGAGMVFGAAGHQYVEYRRVEPSARRAGR